MSARHRAGPAMERCVVALAMATLAWLAGIAGAAAQAQDRGDVRAFTLKQAFDAAWQRQPESRSAAARQQAADAQAAVARSWTAEPAALELSTKTDRLSGNHGAREYEAGVAVPLWLPGERRGAQALAQAELDAVASRVDAARWRLAAAVREAWWTLQRAALDGVLARARLANAQQLAADVARRVKAGDLSRADQHQADAAVAAAQAALAEAQAAHVLARQTLRSHTGAAIPEPAPSADEPPRSEPPPDAARAGGEPRSDHPALRDLGARADVARRTRELASLQTRANPELTISTTRDRGAFGDAYAQSLTFGVRIPFGSDDRRQVRLANAAAELTEAEAQFEIEQTRIATEIAAAEARADAARAMADAAERRAALAVETRRLIEKSFRLGETDLPARLRVELEAFEAERQRERSRIELAQAISQWRQALGLLPE
ncbi:MAG: TolC family protein [Burkholderiaceae bacterium]